MGLAASSARLLSLVARQHDNNRQMLTLTRTKVSLANEVNAAAKDYQNALNAKTLQWNNGTSSVDLSYAILMRPNSNNPKNPVLVTDSSSGKIVVDTKYKKYAEMISPNGTSLGTYEGSTRSAILSELTGISEDVINNADATSASRDSAASQFLTDENEYTKWLGQETKKTNTDYKTVDELAENLGSSSGIDLSKMYKNNSELTFNSSKELNSYIDSIYKNLGQYFVDDKKYLNCTDNEKFKKACEDTKTFYEDEVAKGNKNGEIPKSDAEVTGLTKDGDEYRINVQSLFKMIMTNYTGTSSTKSNDTNVKTYAFRDTLAASWESWYKELQTKYDKLETSSNEYDSTVESANMAMTADQEAQIEFYDNLFTAIVDNGWVYESQANDNDYINQMFQNNAYYITTMKKNDCYDESFGDVPQNWKYEYDSSLASDYENIIAVNANDTVRKAQAKYEAEKTKLNQKETRIDLKMEDLETEQSAIEKMIESIKNVEKENIDRTFKLWS